MRSGRQQIRWSSAQLKTISEFFRRRPLPGKTPELFHTAVLIVASV
ncbi:hypothetical Protein YC6258_03578 [Gynuella sunshinyii YC6258]|uniref:Uncharacterized protein n=1 Tax=Gynuella sunshinyii YC6258 TaxID=1445510 RepID=A0A0C5VYW9_9GAMM|nr:hypothetical Protein YC6258_03578 [Gynuella sunshinyii YC6258]